MEKKFYSLIFSHNTRLEGGGLRIHIGQSTLLPLCGKKINRLFDVGGEVDEQWINQPDPDGELCKSCKRKSLKIIKDNELR